MFSVFFKEVTVPTHPTPVGLPGRPSCLVLLSSATRVSSETQTRLCRPPSEVPAQSPCSHKRSTVAHKSPPIRAPLASSVSPLATFSFPGDTPAQKSQTDSAWVTPGLADRSERGPASSSCLFANPTLAVGNFVQFC